MSWPSEHSKEEQDMRMKALDKEFDYPGFVANHYASHFQNGWSAAYKALTLIHLAETAMLRQRLIIAASALEDAYEYAHSDYCSSDRTHHSFCEKMFAALITVSVSK